MRYCDILLSWITNIAFYFVKDEENLHLTYQMKIIKEKSKRCIVLYFNLKPNFHSMLHNVLYMYIVKGFLYIKLVSILLCYQCN